MLLGYVSDENYIALADVIVEVRCGDRTVETRSTASGAIYVECPAERCEVVLSRDGYGAKRCVVDASNGEPAQLRMLSNRMYGYMWPKWVAAGATAEVRVSAGTTYGVELWHCGWEMRRVALLGYDKQAPAANRQITPDGDYSQSGVAWAHQREPFIVEAPERSGLYCLFASSEDGGSTAFPWIVTPSHHRSAIAVLASSATWNAYNSFGGRSNYISPVALPATPSVNLRQDLERYTHPDLPTWRADDYAPLSFDRPEPRNVIPRGARITDAIPSRDACALAAAEWRLLGWLERENLDYDLYSDVQLHFDEIDLDAYRVLVLNTHPEYWSARMYRRVREWVMQGGRLAYLGGNGINCEVDFPDPQTMVVRNGDVRVLEADRPRLQSRFGMNVEPEATLLGVGFTRAGLMTGAPYKVVDAEHWVFEGTGLRNGDIFGEQSVHTRSPGGASGHETDKMSISSPPTTRLLAKGMNPNGSGAEMTYYELESGGAVFSVGSISYPCSLPVDDTVARITSNVMHHLLAGS